jgi:ADP-heptose:LPS heptosyltransferase
MKIIIVQLGRIGDAVLTTSMFRVLDQSFQDVQLYVLTSKRGVAIFNQNKRLSKVLVYRKDPVSLLFLLIRLQFIKFDWWIDPKDHYSKEASFLAKICRAKKKIGFNKTPDKPFSIGLPSDKDNFLCHAVERNINSLLPLGIPKVTNFIPELFPDQSLQKDIREKYTSSPDDSVLINISAFHPERYWQTEKWIFVVTTCIKKQYRVFLTFKPEDLPLAEFIKNQAPEAVIFRSTSINDVVALMQNIGFVITPDTSIVHIATAFNVPQIALFTNLQSNLHKFKPLSSKSIVIQSDNYNNLLSITETEVVDAFEKLIHE